MTYNQIISLGRKGVFRGFELCRKRKTVIQARQAFVVDIDRLDLNKAVIDCRDGSLKMNICLILVLDRKEN